MLSRARAFSRAFGFAFLLIGCGLLAGCNSETADNGVFNSAKLPRVAGAKEITASPAVTIFTSPTSVAQTADAVDKALTEAGWQKYNVASAARAGDANMRTMTLKKGTQAVNVFITVAPAQGNATSVQYAALPLKTELPFAKDATEIEYSPDRPQLSLVTAQPAKDALEFYRKELGDRGWALWSAKTGTKQAAGGAPGVMHRRGAYAEYVNDKEPSVVMVLTALDAGAGKTRLEIKQWPIATLKTGRAVPPAPQIDVMQAPKLAGAEADSAHATKDDVRYYVAMPVDETSAAVAKLLAGEGWQRYSSPTEKPSATLMFFKKGPQGLVVSLTQRMGQPSQSSVNYRPNWIYVDAPLADDAAEIVFDDRRPYLNYVTASNADTLADFYLRELGAAGWVPLTDAEAAAHWPGAKLEGKTYFVREKQKPILLSMQPRDGRTNVEIRVAAFAQPQALDAGDDIFGLPRPKQAWTAGGTGGSVKKEMHAMVPAEVATVLAFYRNALSSRNWKEESDGAAVTADHVKLNFTSPEGPATLEIGRNYDFAQVNLVQQMTKPAAAAAPAAPAAQDNSIDAMMRQAQQMMRDAGVPPMNAAPPAANSNSMEQLRALADAAKKAQAESEKMTDAVSPAASADDLAVEDKNGLPLPKRHTMSVVDKSPFRRSLNANIPLGFSDVLGFYRRELGKLNWKENAGASVAAESASIAYASPEGPAALKLGRKGGETTVSLIVRHPAEAEKAGVAPKPGQARLLVTNPNDKEATLTVGRQTVKAAANSGTNGPGVMLDVAPGRHKVSVKLAGQTSGEDEIEVGADESWGLLIGPGGVLPVQVY
ncbi:MAG TPA: hypothetical protein VNR41_00085 [Xanthobacteraceae bacterium]|nr:hypothetical protein [Xanthobacteraceae bacterium]